MPLLSQRLKPKTRLAQALAQNGEVIPKAASIKSGHCVLNNPETESCSPSVNTATWEDVTGSVAKPVEVALVSLDIESAFKQQLSSRHR